MKQTAVEWLQDSLYIHFSFEQQMQFEGLFQQAKEMEKQQSNKLLNVTKDCREKLDAEVHFGESDSYDVMV